MKHFIDILKEQVGQDTFLELSEIINHITSSDISSINSTDQNASVIFWKQMEKSWTLFMTMNVTEVFRNIEIHATRIIVYYFVRKLKIKSNIQIYHVEENIITGIPIYIHEVQNTIHIFINKKYLYDFLEQIHGLYVLMKYTGWNIYKNIDKKQEIAEKFSQFNDKLVSKLEIKKSNDVYPYNELYRRNKMDEAIYSLFNKMSRFHNPTDENASIIIIVTFYILLQKTIEIYCKIHKMETNDNIKLILPVFNVHVKQKNNVGECIKNKFIEESTPKYNISYGGGGGGGRNDK